MIWHPGDPVGTGRVYLPDAETRRQYAEQCRAEIVEHKARKAVAAGEPDAIRQRIDQVPESMREAVRDRARELWQEQQQRRG